MRSTLRAAERRARFEALALPFAGQLERTARRLTGGGADATDLVQETYLRAYRTFEGFSAGTNCKAWLFTILYSVFVNRYRKGRREPLMVSIDDVENGSAELLQNDDYGDPPADIEARRTSVEVVAALGRLPEMFRSAIELVDLRDLSYEQAAAALDCPIGTLRSRLFRARKRLVVSLRNYALEAGYLKPSRTK